MAITPDSRLEQIANGEKLTPNSREEYFLEKLAEGSGGGGGGSDLPEPGTAGNVLTSTGDGWESAAPPKGYDEYIVDFVNNDETYSPYHEAEPVTIAEIIAARAAGKLPIGVLPNGFRLALGVIGEYMIAFSGSYYDASVHKGIIVTLAGFHSESDAWFYFEVAMPHPNGQNGYILGVNNGVYALISPSALSNAPYIIHITKSGTSFSTTETVAEIIAAFTAGKAIQGRYHFEVTEGEPLVADVNVAVESITNVSNGTVYVLTVSWHDDTQTTKRLYLDMEASATTDVFSVSI